jgi:predicted alpha/beta-fold hydrolase
VLGAVAVSVPFRLDQCADRIGQGFSKVYQAHFMREMVAYIKNKQRQFQHDGREDGLAALAALGSLENMRTFWDFDGRVTAPLHGFTDAEDYYRRASSRYFLGEIRTPTLIIQAADDPFVFPTACRRPKSCPPAPSSNCRPRAGTSALSMARSASPATTWNGASRNGWPV